MIYDSVSKLKQYKCIPHLDKILEFMETNDLLKLPEGDKEILGRDLYLRALRYFPKSEKENRFETHQVYGDIQIVLGGGVEKIQTTSLDNLTPIMEYDPVKDIRFYSPTAKGNVSDIVLQTGEFLVFFPGEVHKPACFYKEISEPIKKFVFKLKNG